MRTKLPSPAYREYVEFVATALVAFAVLQYAGVFFGDPGELDPSYLVGFGVVLPISAYVLTVILAHVAWVSQWDRMVRSDE